MDEKKHDMIQTVLNFNKDFTLIPDVGRGFRREGQKSVVEADLRVFNGQPQLVVFYGKVRYTFNIQARAKSDSASALMSIRGYHGVETIESILKEMQFSEEAVEVRRQALKAKGI